jgi:hypothetical protein
MQWTDLVGHLNLSAVFTHGVFKSELIGLKTEHKKFASLIITLFLLTAEYLFNCF